MHAPPRATTFKCGNTNLHNKRSYSERVRPTDNHAWTDSDPTPKDGIQLPLSGALLQGFSSSSFHFAAVRLVRGITWGLRLFCASDLYFLRFVDFLPPRLFFSAPGVLPAS